MHRTKAILCVCFCAGLLGALFNSLAVWLGGNLGLPQLAGVDLTPQWSLAWLYPRLIWGGLWGLAYFITVASPRARSSWIRKGLWASLLPTAWQLFYTFTPLFVIGYNLIWGFFTGFFARLLWGRS